MADDAELLRRYSGTGSEAAFTELVSRHLRLVYFTALRRTGGDAALAQEVAQFVFCTVARKAAALATHRTLTGWLYTATRHVADKSVRKEQTRRRYEEDAAMHELTTAEPARQWEHVRPIIDDVLDALSEAEREAILLRFFEGRAFADVGATLRVSEDAARMRVERALDKLRRKLERRGVRSASGALAIVLSTQAGLAVPTGMVGALSGAAVAAGTGTTGAAVLLGFMSATKFSVAATAVAAVLATGFGLIQRNRAEDAEANLRVVTDEQKTLTARLARAEDQVSRVMMRAAEADRDSGRLLAAIEAAQAKPPPPARSDPSSAALASSPASDPLVRRLNTLFPNGIVATVGDQVITVEDIRQQMAPSLARLQSEASDSEEFSQRLNGLQNAVVKDSVERILLVKEFRSPNEGEPPKSIPPEYVDNTLAQRLTDKFANDPAKLAAYLESRGLSHEQYRKQLEEEIAFRYMKSRQRQLSQNSPAAAAK